jgi:tRNA dimethylallyltransferase
MNDPVTEIEAPIRNAVLIAGPTASGKSALALEHARRSGGVIVNADSMQVYGVLRVLTARPGEAELSAAPHLLYGHVDPATSYSTGAWLRDVLRLAESGAFEEKTPIFVGGTGLYFRALLGGLSEMPEVPAHVRERWRRELSEKGPLELHGMLEHADPEAASRIMARDGQRIIRALEILEATGKPISVWQKLKGRALVDTASLRRIVIEPDRALLARRIEERLDDMVRHGALDEVRALLDRRLDPALPAMKAIGVRPFARQIGGEIDAETAIGEAVIETRQYAKRQMTWFRNQMDALWERRGIAD